MDPFCPCWVVQTAGLGRLCTVPVVLQLWTLLGHEDRGSHKLIVLTGLGLGDLQARRALTPVGRPWVSLPAGCGQLRAGAFPSRRWSLGAGRAWSWEARCRHGIVTTETTCLLGGLESKMREMRPVSHFWRINESSLLSTQQSTHGQAGFPGCPGIPGAGLQCVSTD